MYKLLICGHNGFVGQYLFDYLNKYYEIYGADKISETNNKEFHVDFNNLNHVKNLLELIKPDYIINLIGLNRSDFLNQLIDTNLNCISNILQSIVDLNLKNTKIIHTSSSAVYGNKNIHVDENSIIEPVNFYGLSKLLSEKICIFFRNNFKLNIIIVRPSNIIGKNLSESFVLPKLIKKLLEAKFESKTNLNLGNLNIRRDFIDIKDLIEAYRIIIKTENNILLYNVSQGKSVSLFECVDTICKQIDFKPDLQLLNEFESEQMDLVCNNSRLKDIGYESTISVSESIIQMTEFIKAKQFLGSEKICN